MVILNNNFKNVQADHLKCTESLTKQSTNPIIINLQVRVQAAHGERVLEGGGCGAGLKGEGVEGGPPGVPAQQLTHFILVHG